MFIEWGFLLGEIWILLVLAALLGLLAGWIIWGGKDTQASLDAEEVQRLRLALEKERARARASVTSSSDVMPVPGGGYVRPIHAQTPAVSPDPIPEPEPEILPPEPDTAPDPLATAASAPKSEGPTPKPEPAPSLTQPTSQAPAASEGQRPASLDGPRDGIPDDLTKIKGIGKKMERLCNDLGFYHYEQIAAWTEEEVAWVDDHLADFKGRVSRDNWVEQAKDLAGDFPPPFVRRTSEN